MKNRYVLIVLWLVLAPAAQAQHWYKGNLHTHSLWSDGDDYPEMIMDWYKANGYNFVGLSDHNIIQDVEKWVNVPRQKDRRQTFDRYLRNFGPDWVTYQKGPNDSLKVRLKKLEEYRSHFEEPGKFLIIKSEELSTGYQGKPIHINVTNVQNLIRPQPGNSVAEVMQNNIDLVVAQRRQTRQPMFPHINHPNFYYAITAHDLMKLRHERFFEVFNGHPLVNNYGDSTREGTEAMWDKINHHFIQQGRPLMYGLGTDDSHHYYFFGPTFSNSGRAWVMVNAPELTPKALIEAMEAGRFYSTSGVTLNQLPQQGNTLRIDVKPEPKITYKIQFFGIRKGAQQAELLREVSDTTASFTLTNDLLLIRAKIISSKPKYNPYIQSGRPEDAVETAWTQPIAQSIPPTPVANVVPLPNAHAHNDYEQSRPLWDALDNGFASIEADVHLLDDTLYVAHERPSIKRPELSLETLYLKPLAERIRQNNGQVLAGYKGPFYLMIDVKTQADSTYRAIEKLISRYQSLLTNKGQRLLTVVISGNRPLQALTKAKSRLLAVDGRPDDLGKGYQQAVMPIISDAYQNQLTWRGKGDIPASEFQKLRQLVDKTHQEGKKLRLWASPEDPQVWAKLREAGVDLISTDQLELARDFLLKQNR